MVSLKIFRLPWPRFFRLFSFFLVGTLITELFAVNWMLWLHSTTWWHFSKSNLWIYNIYYVPQYVLYYLFFYHALDKPVAQLRTFRFICLTVIIGGIGNLLFVQGIDELNTYTIILGSIGVIFFCFHYFRRELLQSSYVKPFQNPMFWITTGALIFHMTTLPYFVFINYLSKYSMKLAITLFTIILFLNIFMYSMYLIAFLCKNPLPKSSY